MLEHAIMSTSCIKPMGFLTKNKIFGPFELVDLSSDLRTRIRTLRCPSCPFRSHLLPLRLLPTPFSLCSLRFLLSRCEEAALFFQGRRFLYLLLDWYPALSVSSFLLFLVLSDYAFVLCLCGAISL